MALQDLTTNVYWYTYCSSSQSHEGASTSYQASHISYFLFTIHLPYLVSAKISRRSPCLEPHIPAVNIDFVLPRLGSIASLLYPVSIYINARWRPEVLITLSLRKRGPYRYL
jgi:hypothetical protein